MTQITFKKRCKRQQDGELSPFSDSQYFCQKKSRLKISTVIEGSWGFAEESQCERQYLAEVFFITTGTCFLDAWLRTDSQRRSVQSKLNPAPSGLNISALRPGTHSAQANIHHADKQCDRRGKKETPVQLDRTILETVEQERRTTSDWRRANRPLAHVLSRFQDFNTNRKRWNATSDVLNK